MGRHSVIVRDLHQASARSFDLVVIGGGIYGAALAHQAARRGVSVCLCEAEDFGGGTSWNSLRIVHGGLRYLQTWDPGRFRRAVRARRGLARMFPSLLRPLHCLMPLYGEGLKRRSVMRVATAVNDLLSYGCNDSVPPSLHLTPGRALDPAQTRRVFPLARPGRLQGAAVWSDLFMLSSERILIELLRDACRRGALVLNYARVIGVMQDKGSVTGVRLDDRLGCRRLEIAAGKIVNCSGAALDAVGATVPAADPVRPSLAFNLLLDIPPPSDYTVAVQAPDRRAPVHFMVPLAGRVLAGTMHVPRAGRTAQAQPSATEMATFIAMLNAAIPGLGVRHEQVLRVFAGWLPVTLAGSVDLVRSSMCTDHGRRGGPRGLYSLTGVKFTSAIEDARRMLDVIGWRAPAPVAGDPSDESPLPLAAATPLLVSDQSVDESHVESSLGQIVEEESVQFVDDLLFRRSNWFSTGSEPLPGFERLGARLGVRVRKQCTPTRDHGA